MPVDLTVFERQKSIIDQQQLQDAFELKKALAIQSAQKSALETQALQAQADMGGLSVKDLLTLQMNQQNKEADRALRDETNAANRQYRQDALAQQEQIAQAQLAQARDLANMNINAKIDERQRLVDEKQSVKDKGKQDFEDGLANLAKYYKELKDLGGITSVNDGRLSNLLTSTGTSDIGQFVGKKLGTKTQSLRNSIASTVPLLTQSIKTATGMSAQQMNSNVELQTMLKALGNPNLDIESNADTLIRLSKQFGTGEVASGLEQSFGATPTQASPNLNTVPVGDLPPAPGATPTNVGATTTAPVTAYKEGDTATNPQTGKRITFRNGQWQ